MSPPFPNAPKPSWYRNFEWESPTSKRNGVHYVGDTVTLELNLFGAKATANLEDGVNGNNITTAIEEGSLTPWSSVEAILGNTATYSTTQVAHGSLSARMFNNGSSSGPFLRWGSLGERIDYYGRGYTYWTANPATETYFHAATLDGLDCWILRLNSSGIIRLSDAAGTVRLTFTTPVALNQWTRIEYHIDHTNGDAEVKLFNSAESSTPTETQTGSGALRGTADLFYYAGAHLNSTMYWDDIIANATSYPGPYNAGTEQQPNPASTITYTVRDYFGTIVSTGSMAESVSSFQPNVPAGGWKPGWYRVYLTGPQTDTNFNDSYGVTNFCVIRSDSHFTAMPAGDTSGGQDPANDFVMKGVMGGGTSRMQIENANAPTTGSSTLAKAVLDADLTADYWSDNGLPDTGRPSRKPWLQFPNGTADNFLVPGASGDWGRFYAATAALDGSQIFLTISAGTNANTDKVQIHYPNAGTLVETYDNLVSNTAAQTAINAASVYVRFYAYNSSRASYPPQTAIGNDYHDGVGTVVATLYPLGVTRYEGPFNEPPLDAETAHQMMLFQGAVHDGNASAIAIGPGPVNISDLTNWGIFLDAGGGDYCDELSFHAYNFDTNGDLNLGRYTLQAFKALLTAHGQGSKPLWQTESTGGYISTYKIYHPRRARRPLLATLILEENGCPRERNNWWYDVSHGFWAFSQFHAHSDGSLNPHVVLGRVLAEETWGKSYDSALDFGTLGDAIYLGSVYVAADGSSTVVLMATSYMTGASVALTISGTAGPVTVVDGFGNQKSMPLSKGRITLPMTDIPVYVRLPVGASASVYRINGWSPLGTGTSVSAAATTKQIDGSTFSVIADDGYITFYETGTGIAPPGSALEGPYAETPGNTTLIWTNPTLIERVLVWCGSCWQSSGTLIDFDVQTYDGSIWTTQKTVTKPDPDWFYFGSDEANAGCFVETYWDEQWIFDVELAQSVSCRGVRLNVRQASYGGEPLACPIPWEHGQGTPTEGYKIQEIAVIDTVRYAGVGV